MGNETHRVEESERARETESMQFVRETNQNNIHKEKKEHVRVSSNKTKHSDVEKKNETKTTMKQESVRKQNEAQ